jgi:UDP:flavonoid glycosyltransferase YjiC (YdhE family)
MEFLEAGPPPVYLGFSSMIPRDPEASMNLMLDALRQANARGIVGTGWMTPGRSEVPGNVLVLDEIPHDWLFPRVSAVVHHGGAGTVAAGIRAGVPAIVVPFYADQPFWAERVRSLGVGPAPIPERRLTAERLADAIRLTLIDDGMRRTAEEIGKKLRTEDGVGTAVEIVDQVLS